MNNLISGLPFIKTIDEFDFTSQPKLDRQKVMLLFNLTFIRYKQNVIFLVPPGVGKTHLAVALAVKACQSVFSIYSTNIEDLIKKLKKDHDSNRRGKGRSYYLKEMSLTQIGVGDRRGCRIYTDYHGRMQSIFPLHTPYSSISALWTPVALYFTNGLMKILNELANFSNCLCHSSSISLRSDHSLLSSI
ncbi:MAG: hypothetical protein DRP89_05865 [Candidatus Neomarinimicrobiota bacterium]|nr:MAG: hypothetical protein DRP89_05865 [Candidatus Neomarinimicrobiota bacterium]